MKNLKIALLNDLRKYLTDPASRGTSQTDTFSGDNSTTKFVLTKRPVMYIDSITISGTSKKLNRDYTLNFGTSSSYGNITFGTAPDTGTDNISITYKYGKNWIYPGSPYSKAEMPRIAIRRIGGGESGGGVGDKVVFWKPIFRIGLWIRGGNEYTIGSDTYSGDKLLDYMETDIGNQIRAMRDVSEPYNVITMRIEDGVDIDFDQEYDLYRREIRLYIHYQKVY